MTTSEFDVTKITKRRFLAALRRVRDGLRDGSYQRTEVTCDKDGIYSVPPLKKRGYDQLIVAKISECGTAACIAGWTAIELGAKTDDDAVFCYEHFLRQWNDPDERGCGGRLDDLFQPLKHVTPAAAALAIDRFLSGEKRIWLRKRLI